MLGDVCCWRSSRHSVVRWKKPFKGSRSDGMCGRANQSSRPLRLAIVEGLHVSDSRMGNVRPATMLRPAKNLRSAPLHRAGRRLLRVAGHQRRTLEAALCNRYVGWLTLWSSWTVGELAQSDNRRRKFVVSRVLSNELVGQIHTRMPEARNLRARKLRPLAWSREPDPRELLISYPSEPLTRWPISTRVNAPENDDPSLLDCTTDISTSGLP